VHALGEVFSQPSTMWLAGRGGADAFASSSPAVMFLVFAAQQCCRSDNVDAHRWHPLWASTSVRVYRNSHKD